ncbi:unnamed protein product [Ascophyllum nodosum]
MGSVFGKDVSPELSPEYDVVGEGSNYEIRAYKPYLVAEVEAGTDASTEDDRFRTLGNYIGVLGSPANKGKEGEDQGERIQMTAPVVLGGPPPGGEKISMTAPVVQGPGEGAGEGPSKMMQFIMPRKFKSISELPTPTDERVKLREVPEKLYIVRQFSGNMGTGGGHDASAELERANTEKGVKADGGALAEYVGEDAKYLVAKYNPPWTLPFLKTNELWFPLPLSREEAAAKLPEKK